MNKELFVIKRNGSLQNFNEDKIVPVVQAAGLNDEQSRALAKRVTVWAKLLHKKSISSLDIRDKVLEELKKVKPAAADLYEWYQRTKEI